MSARVGTTQRSRGDVAMVEEREWEASLEAAWGQLRGDVADVLAGLGDGECVFIEWGPELLDDSADDSNPGGTAPYVQATGWGESMVRIEAVSNYYLDDRYALGEVEEDALEDLGWFEPTCAPEVDAEGGSSNFWFDVEAREADLAAVLMVRALREVYGCLHPSLLSTSGVYPETEATEANCECDGESAIADLDDLPTSWPASRGELHGVVMETLGAIRGEQPSQDADGDVPIVVGRSVVFVRVLGNRPGVELFAEVVLSVERADPLALARELNILNRSHPFYSFHVLDGVVMMRQLVAATPFVPYQLKVALETFCSEVDDIARDLVERIGGHRFIGASDGAAAQDVGETGLRAVKPIDSAIPALVEMLRDGRLPTRSVIELFQADRARLVEALSEVRAGGVACEPVGHERVLETLRRAARAVTRADAQRSRSEGQPPEGARLSVLDGDEGSNRRRA